MSPGNFLMIAHLISILYFLGFSRKGFSSKCQMDGIGSVSQLLLAFFPFSLETVY